MDTSIMWSSAVYSTEEKLDVTPVVNEFSSSSSDPPMEDWSSLLISNYQKNPKVELYERGLYSPDSGDVCAKYITLSDSDVFRHVYYRYPALVDPGIVSALCDPEPKKELDPAGQNLYLNLCDETGLAPVTLFYKGLLKDVINLRYYCVNPNGVRNMCLALENNKIVQKLDLTSSFLNDDACYHLGELIANTSTIKELILAQCRIGESGLLRLLSPIKVLNLDNLDLSKNCFGNEGITLLTNKMIKGAKIKKLNLSCNDLGLNAALDLAKAFSYNKRCTKSLNLSFNFLNSPKAIRELVTSLYDSPSLVELNLAWNAIKGGPYIADFLLAKALKKLDLSHNILTVQAVEAIRKRLLINKTLTILDLSSNPLKPREAYEMMQQLRFRKVKLQELLMNEIDVTKEFPVAKQKILALKYRANTKVTHGRVMGNYTLLDADFRDILMKRFHYLGCRGPKKHRVDVIGYFLEKRKHFTVLSPKMMLMDLKRMDAKLDPSLIEKSLPMAFPGPRIDKNTRAINLESLADYIARMWPDAQAPPTPPSTETPPGTMRKEEKNTAKEPAPPGGRGHMKKIK